MSMATIDVHQLYKETKEDRDTIESAVGGMRIRVKSRGRITLIIGGERSGKSSYAQDYALDAASDTNSRYFIATAERMDDEMSRRIIAHQTSRAGRFHTIEEPIKLAEAIRSLPADAQVCVVDCLTVWMGNLIYHKALDGAVDSLLSVLENPPCDIVLVTNETGLGVIPADPESRLFVEQAGRLHQKVAALARNVILMIAGIPVPIKGKLL